MCSAYLPFCCREGYITIHCDPWPGPFGVIPESHRTFFQWRFRHYGSGVSLSRKNVANTALLRRTCDRNEICSPKEKTGDVRFVVHSFCYHLILSLGPFLRPLACSSAAAGRSGAAELSLGNHWLGDQRRRRVYKKAVSLDDLNDLP